MCIVLTQVFTLSILVLTPGPKIANVPFVSLLNSCVTRSLQTFEKAFPVELAPNPVSFNFLIILCLFFSKILSSRVGMLHNVYNFDGPTQKTHRLICLEVSDSTGNITDSDVMIKLMSHYFHFLNHDFHYLQTILPLIC